MRARASSFESTCSSVLFFSLALRRGSNVATVAGIRVVLVSSGAVSVGCQRLGLAERPKEIIMKQAVAAVGQGRLIALYDNLFSALGQPIAQVLLTRENVSSELHYFNALNTFHKLLDMGIVPIVNENDTVSGSLELNFLSPRES